MPNNKLFKSHTLFGETPILFGKTLYNLAKPYFLAKVRGFAKKYPSFPNRHVISGIKKAKKEGSTTHCDEPHQARKALISSHFYTLLPNRSKFLWHQFFIAACAAVRLRGLFTPLKSGFGKKPLLLPTIHAFQCSAIILEQP